MVQWLRFHTPSAGGLCSIPGQGTRPHMPQLRVPMPQLKRAHVTQKGPRAAAKTWHSQKNHVSLKWRVSLWQFPSQGSLKMEEKTSPSTPFSGKGVTKPTCEPQSQGGTSRCPCVESSLVMEESICYEPGVLLAKLYQPFPCFIMYCKAIFACYSRYFLTSYFCIPVPCNKKDIFLGVSSRRSCRSS